MQIDVFINDTGQVNNNKNEHRLSFICDWIWQQIATYMRIHIS